MQTNILYRIYILKCIWVKSVSLDIFKKLVIFCETLSYFFGNLSNDMIKNKTFFQYNILDRVKISQSLDLFGLYVCQNVYKILVDYG